MSADSLPRRVAGALLVVCLLIAARRAPAQIPYLVRDVATAPSDSSTPYAFCGLNGLVVFAAYHPQYGYEPWVSDGTPGGTHLLRDINPGLADGLPRSGSTLALNQLGDTDTIFMPCGPFVCFAANDPQYGWELWRTDGTPQGTTLVMDLIPGPTGAGPNGGAVYASNLLFAATTEQGRELWRSDGTPEGTALVLDINPGSASSSPKPLGAVPGAVLYYASDAEHGRELWRSDGTPAGTTLVADILAGSGGQTATSGNISVTMSECVCFLANDGVAGLEVWQSDGTPEGTQLLVDFTPGAASSSLTYMRAAAGHLFFTANVNGSDTVWAMNVALGQAEQIRLGASTKYLVELGSSAYFVSGSYEVWRSNGTLAGTSPVATLNNSIYGLLPLADRLLIARGSNSNGRELAVHVPATNTTALVKDIWPGTGHGLAYPVRLYRVGDLCFISASDGQSGYEPWVTDGTAASTVLWCDAAQAASSTPRELIDVAGTLYFRAHEAATGTEVWRSAGDANSTNLVADTLPGPDPEDWGAHSWPTIAAVGNRAFFAGWYGGLPFFESLWVDDGTTATRLTGYFDRIWGVFGGAELAYFSLTGEIWRSAGTPADTFDLLSTGTGIASMVRPSADRAFFYRRSATGFELVSTDGTPEGCVPVFAGGSSAGQSAILGPRFFTGWNEPTHGAELWGSDGTPEGSGLVLDINPGTPSSTPQLCTRWGGRIAFTADDGGQGRELWTSDGTPEGTAVVADVQVGAGGADPNYLAAAGPLLYFVADDGLYGRELWRTDGTSEGTLRLTDLGAGPDSALITAVYGYKAEAYFAAYDAAAGVELWRSDGTVEGTQRFADLEPGPGHSHPNNFTLSGGRLYFTAYRSDIGTELWAVPVPPLGDVNGDGIAAIGDALSGLSCLAGPGIAQPPPGCTYLTFARTDLNDDGAVDLADVAGFQTLLSE